MKSGNPSDYDYGLYCTWGDCVAHNDLCTEYGKSCSDDGDCIGGERYVTGDCGCRGPKAHSHQVKGCTDRFGNPCHCQPIGTCAYCDMIRTFRCVPKCSRVGCSVGKCYYDCDEGYTWNGEACVLPPPKVKAGLHPAKVLPLILDD